MSPRLVALLFCAACYGPDVPECTLACTADTDCVAGQACSRDGLCAASAETQCSQRQMPGDGAQAAVDASGSGSGSGSAISMVSVHVTVHGPGSVFASIGTTCTSDCTFAVEQGMPMTFTATPSSANHSFDSWSGACASQPALCHVTASVAISVGAKFSTGD